MWESESFDLILVKIKIDDKNPEVVKVGAIQCTNKATGAMTQDIWHLFRLPSSNLKPSQQLMIGVTVWKNQSGKQPQYIFLWNPDDHKSERVVIYNSPGQIVSYLSVQMQGQAIEIAFIEESHCPLQEYIKDENGVLKMRSTVSRCCKMITVSGPLETILARLPLQKGGKTSQ